ncbi:ROK family protein [Enterococcus sp. 2201sp1_2201st1_B8_2201SCRN_220225]|uniref:ROK family protein n=1 Tax=unclassified Enterococcus TaxID=2608891 RepID=UPI0034A3C40A
MFVGFDIGGTTIKYGLLDEKGQILAKSSIETSYDVEQLITEMAEIVANYQIDYPEIKGIGISAPGIIQKDGFMLTAGAIKPLYGKNLKQSLEERCHLPVAIENDANAAAIAEKWLGNARGIDNYLCLVLGTGIGGGIVMNGEVFRGAHGMAGEFGWMMIDQLPDTGDIEEVSSNKKAAVVGGLCYQYDLARKAQEGSELPITDARELFAREAAGEQLAHEIIERFFVDLSVTLLNLISCFDPEVILVGGGISANPAFNQRLQGTLANVKARHSSIHYLDGQTIAPIRTAKLQNDAGMIGAVYEIYQQLIK